MDLFNTKKCDVPHIPDYDYTFVTDCEILPAPPPIFDCPLIEIPFETPIPEFDFNVPCPILNVTPTTAIEFYGDACGNPTFDAATTLTTTRDGNSCQLDLVLDLDIKIPPPRVRCPTIESNSNLTLVTGAAAANTPPVLDFVFTNTTTDSACNPNRVCKYTMDVDLTIPIPTPPCPVIETTGSEVRVHTYDPIRAVIGGSSSYSVAASTVDVIVTPYNAGTSSQPACGIAMDFMFNLAIPVHVPDTTIINSIQYGMTGMSIDIGDPWGDDLPVFSMTRYMGPNQSVTPCCDECDTPKIVLLRRPHTDVIRSICVVATRSEMTGISTIQSTFRAWFMGICCAAVRGPVTIGEYLMPDAYSIGVSDTYGTSNCKSLDSVPSGQVRVIPVMLLTRDTCTLQWRISIVGGPTSGTLTVGVYGGTLSGTIPVELSITDSASTILFKLGSATGVIFQVTAGASFPRDEIAVVANDQRIKLTLISYSLPRVGAIVPFARMTSCCY